MTSYEIGLGWVFKPAHSESFLYFVSWADRNYFALGQGVPGVHPSNATDNDGLNSFYEYFISDSILLPK